MRLSAALKKSPKNTVMLAPPGVVSNQPAPTQGWNARDPLPLMNPADAVVLDNYFATTADVRLRGGSINHATGMTGPAETLINYSSPTAEQLWAIAAGKIYNVSAGGAVPAAAVTGLTNSRWQFTNFSTSGNHFVTAVNGIDSMRLYDGTTWQAVTAVSAPYAITGVATTSLAAVFNAHKRLFLLENHALGFWFLPVDNVAGAATFYDLGPQFKRGGYVIAGGNWTRDGGDGMDDLTVFITNLGEVVVYSGSDPSDATDWTLIGRYDIPPPIGRRCTIKTGADLALITIDGVIGLSTIISIDRAQSNKVALSDRIRNAFNEAARQYRDSFGWEAISYPAGSMVLFNIPVQEGLEQQQFVINATTSAWCRFLGWDARTWVIFNERLYYADNSGNVVLADEGNDDNGEAIVGHIQTAFVYHAGKGRQKSYQMVKPIIFSGPALNYGLSLLVDFETNSVATIVDSSGDDDAPAWDTATWDVSPWSSLGAIKNWRNTPAVGTCASIVFDTSTLGLPISLSTFDILLIPGGPL